MIRLLVASICWLAFAAPAFAGSGSQCPHSKPVAVEAAAPPEAPPVAKQDAEREAVEVAENAPKAEAPPAGAGGR